MVELMRTISNNLTLIWILGMIVWGIWAWQDFSKSVREAPYGEYDMPKKAQMLGVLGTFVGVAIGLYIFGYSSENMESRVMDLLGGMKTAFVSSILGMGIYLFLSWYQNQKQKEKNEDVPEDSSVADLIRFLKNENEQRRDDRRSMLEAFSENNKILGETISNAIQDMQRSVVGDGEYTVIGQMKQIRLETRDEISKLRDESRQSNEALIKEFRDFAKTMAENNTKTFIEALNETMKDFNTKLTEQFGENFKQLNEAVGRLLDWQKEYRLIIEEVTNTQREIFASIQTIRDSMEHMEKSSMAMTESANNMADLIVTANVYNEKMEVLLRALNDIADDAKELTPAIREMVKTTNDETRNMMASSIESLEKEILAGSEEMKKTVTSGVEHNNKVVDELCLNISNASVRVEKECNVVCESLSGTAEHIKKTGEAVDDLSNVALKNLKKQTDNTVKSMTEMAVALNDASNNNVKAMEISGKATIEAVQKAADSLANSALTITKNVSDNMVEMMNTNNESLKKSSQNISEQLHNNMIDTMKNFGNMMGSISQKFAEDYVPLADKLSDLVRAANNLQTRRG